MTVQSLQGIFIRDLHTALEAEQRIAEMLPRLASETTDEQVRGAFEQHQQETCQQIDNLDRCLTLLGTQPQHVTCHGIHGLVQEREEFLKLTPPAEMQMLFDLGTAMKTEQYEVASYRGLIDKASLLGEEEVVCLLQENLRQEEAMAQKVEVLAREMGRRLAEQTQPVAQTAFAAE